MHPDYLMGMGALALTRGVLRLRPAQKPEELEQQERDRLAAVAAKRAASPEVAAAEAKRQRKAEKLRRIAERSPTHNQ